MWQLAKTLYVHPTDPFTILELHNPSYDVPEQHKIRRSPDFEAVKLWKCLSGIEKKKDLNCKLQELGK